MRCRLVRASRGECREVHVWARCEDGSKRHFVVTGFAPYFYVPSKLGMHVAIDGETVEVVEAECPEEIPKLRENYDKHYEADVPYARRLLIDTGIRDCFDAPRNGSVVNVSDLQPAKGCNIQLRIWFIDIEVLAGHLPTPDNPEHPVILVTVYDTATETYTTYFWHSKLDSYVEKTGYTVVKACGEERERIRWRLRGYPSEEMMLMDMLADWESAKPDVVAGWNVGFDVDYLDARLRQAYVMRLPKHYSLFIDLLEAYKKLGPRQRSYALKEVTVSEGLECREDVSTAQEYMVSWEDSPRDFIVYNLRDVWRIVKLDEIHRLIDFYLAVKAVAGLEDISRHMKPGVYAPYSTLTIVDTVVLRKARERGVVLPTSREAQRSEYKGAIVLEPPGGLWEGVAVFDMSRYYPSLIISFNISPENKERLLDPVNRIWKFREEPEGLLPSSVRELLELREKLEAELQKYRPGTMEYQDIENKIMAVKGITNSFYGVMANPYFRLFDVDVAATITGLAREGILFVVKRAEELGYRPLYGDTDSLFIQVPFEQAADLAKQLTEELKQYFKEKYGLKREPVLKLKFEKYYKRIFFKPKTKKRYAGLLVWKKGQWLEKPKLDVTGFEAIRTDTAPFTAYAQEKVFEAILSGSSRDSILRLVAQLDREARRRPLSDIALYKGLSKDPDKYRQPGPYVRAAIYSNMYLGTRFAAGDKVRYIYVRRVKCMGLPPTDVVAFTPETEARVAECFEIDWSKQLEAILYRPINEILRAIGLQARPGMRFHSFF